MRRLATIFLLVPLAGCGGSDGVPDEVTLSGTATYQNVPHDDQGGLDYAASSAIPIRRATLQVVDTSDASVLASTTTSDTGTYEVTVPGERDVRLRVRAELQKSGPPSWDVRVVDNTAGDALYTLDSNEFNTGGGTTRDIHAPSGWDAGQQAYTSARSAAPFSVLDNILDAMQPVLAVDPDATFPSLVAHWSEDNQPGLDANGQRDDANGLIGTTFYQNGEIFVLGWASQDAEPSSTGDTDEYDDHVIQHEWAHYLEDQFARSDSLGGSHSFFVRLDPRVAFSEGFGNAYSGIGTGRSIYKDSGGADQATGIAVFDMEDNDWSQGIPDGWFNEGSIQSVIYDLFDDGTESGDGVSEGFGPIFATMTGKQTNTPASATIYPFVVGMKANATSASDGDIDTLVESRAIRSSDNDQWGSTEDNDAGAGTLANFRTEDILPVHTAYFTDFDTSETVCAIKNFQVYNGLSIRRFLRLSVGTAAKYTITVTRTSGSGTDPDFVVHRDGERLLVSEKESGETGATETMEENTVSLDAREYTLEVYPYSYVKQDNNSATDDTTCYSVEVK